MKQDDLLKLYTKESIKLILVTTLAFLVKGRQSPTSVNSNTWSEANNEIDKKARFFNFFFFAVS